MNIISINNPSVAKLALATIHENPILIQLPSVFALFAAPTAQGAAQLDALKTRLSGKVYGTAIGSLEKFIAQVNPVRLPYEFSQARQYGSLSGSFIRLPFRDEQVQTKTIANGTHQGLLLPNGPYSTLFKRIEASFESYPAEAMWAGKNYCAPICSSCNVSGDPDGSITEYDKALAFAEARGVKLVITASYSTREKGSYPIFGFERDRVRIHREGPGLASLKRHIPARLSALA